MNICTKCVTHRHMRFAIAAFEAGSFRKAAVSMNVKESTISRSIRDLELAVGFQIFVRRRTGVLLTHSGAKFILLAQEALKTFDSALRIAGSSDLTGETDDASVMFDGYWILISKGHLGGFHLS